MEVKCGEHVLLLWQQQGELTSCHTDVWVCFELYDLIYNFQLKVIYWYCWYLVVRTNIIVIICFTQVCCVYCMQSHTQQCYWHWSYSSGQSTTTEQVSGRTEVSCKLFHSLLAPILEYSLPQSWRQCNWRFWSYCIVWCSESEPELENTGVSNYRDSMLT